MGLERWMASNRKASAIDRLAILVCLLRLGDWLQIDRMKTKDLDIVESITSLRLLRLVPSRLITLFSTLISDRHILRGVWKIVWSLVIVWLHRNRNTVLGVIGLWDSTTPAAYIVVGALFPGRARHVRLVPDGKVVKRLYSSFH